jgi:copper chaperone CopZ
VGVDGMVCDFCVQSLKKIFLKEKGVKNIDISLTDKLLTLILADDTALDDKKIKELVDYAGYKVTTIHHMPKS